MNGTLMATATSRGAMPNSSRTMSIWVLRRTGASHGHDEEHHEGGHQGDGDQGPGPVLVFGLAGFLHRGLDTRHEQKEGQDGHGPPHQLSEDSHFHHLILI